MSLIFSLLCFLMLVVGRVHSLRTTRVDPCLCTLLPSLSHAQANGSPASQLRLRIHPPRPLHPDLRPFQRLRALFPHRLPNQHLLPQHYTAQLRRQSRPRTSWCTAAICLSPVLLKIKARFSECFGAVLHDERIPRLLQRLRWWGLGSDDLSGRRTNLGQWGEVDGQRGAGEMGSSGSVEWEGILGVVEFERERRDGSRGQEGCIGRSMKNSHTTRHGVFARWKVVSFSSIPAKTGALASHTS